ncbi:FlgD-like protein [Thiogranum longum]|uniref:FlgD-like protein n=2 Tax=Thiogranum longum TaxID=1537524 RepID=A0A4R1HAC6_9GAMM|nr:FlgD-like protein [Thiogranum longum]
MKSVSALIAAVVFSATSMGVYALEIERVSHAPAQFIPTKGKFTNINFALSEKADVELKVFDDRDKLVRRIARKDLAAGEQTIPWSGQDEAGHTVPAEAYRYTLTANTTVEHDLSDLTGGETVRSKILWNSDKMQFEYSLDKPSRVLIRVGLENHGPLMATIRNWVPRQAGSHIERWDGKDASGELDLSKHPKLVVSMRAYTLSQNTILVGPEPNQVSFIRAMTWPSESRKVKKKPVKRMIAAQQQSAETRGDYLVNLNLPEGLKTDKHGVPIVTGHIPVMLDVDEKHRTIALNRRSETVFYIDGQFTFENEVGFLPMAWMLDTTHLNNGEHFLSVNLRGYEGNFGLATRKIIVQHPRTSKVP